MQRQESYQAWHASRESFWKERVPPIFRIVLIKKKYTLEGQFWTRQSAVHLLLPQTCYYSFQCLHGKLRLHCKLLQNRQFSMQLCKNTGPASARRFTSRRSDTTVNGTNFQFSKCSYECTRWTTAFRDRPRDSTTVTPSFNLFRWASHCCGRPKRSAWMIDPCHILK